MKNCVFLLALLPLLLLAACAPKWELLDNTVSPSGELRFYNGISINYPGDMQVVFEKRPQQIGGKTMYISVYLLSRNERFAYLAMQVSAENAFQDMLKDSVTDEELLAFVGQFTASMLQRAQEQNPDMPLIGPTITRRDLQASDQPCRVVDLSYMVTGDGQNYSVLIKVILMPNDLIAVMSIEDKNQAENIAAEIFSSIQYET